MLSIVTNNTKLVAPVPGGVDLVGVDEVKDHPEGGGRVNVDINGSFIKRSWIKFGVYL